MSRALIGAVFLLAGGGLTACGGPSGSETAEGGAAGGEAAGGGGAAMCLAAIEFREATYVGVQVPELAVGGEAGQAVTPACNDTGGSGEQPSTPFAVLTVDGLDPSVAVATEAEAGGYWVWYRPVGSGSSMPDDVSALLD